MESHVSVPDARRRRLQRTLAVLVAIIALAAGLATLSWVRPTSLVAVTLGETNELVVVDPIAGRVFSRLPIPGYPSGVAFTPAGDRLLASGWLTSQVTVLTLPGLQVEGTFQVDSRPTGLRIQERHPDTLVIEHGMAGQKAYSLERGLRSGGQRQVGKPLPRGSFKLKNVRGNRSAGPDTSGNRPRNIVIDPKLTEVLVSEGKTDRVVGTVPVGRQPIALGWSPDESKCFVVVNGDDLVAVVDPKEMRVTRTIPVGSSPNFFVRLEGPALGLVLNQRGQSLSVIDMKRDEVRHTIALGGAPTSLDAWPAMER